MTKNVQFEVFFDTTNNIRVGKRTVSEPPDGADRLLLLQRWGPTTNGRVEMDGQSETRELQLQGLD